MAINFPDNPFNGQTTTFSGVTYSYNSTKNQWTANNPSTANISSSDNAPTSPSAGDLWFNSANGVMYIYYNDGSSAQWISISGYASSFDSASTISLIDSDYVQARQTTAASTTIVTDINGLIAISSPSNGDQAYVQSNNNLYFYDSGWYKIATVSNDSPSSITGVSSSYDLDISGGTTTITAVSTDPEGFPLTWSYSTSGLGSIATISQADNVFTITPSTNTANAGSFTLTISVTDGVNGAVSASSTLTLQFSVTNSKYTTALVTAVDTSDNNNITDASSNNYSITANGNSAAGTFSPYRHGGYSTYFDGSSYLVIPDDTSLDMGTGDFTVECWIYLTADDGTYNILSHAATGGMWLGRNGGGSTGFVWRKYGVGDVIIATSNPSTEQWYHIAVCRSSSNTKMYINGTQTGSTASDTSNYTVSASLYIGDDGAAGINYFDGYIRDLRIVKGTAVYTSDFTPTTEPLTAISGTSLLACHLPYFADGSTNNHSFTTTGSVTIEPFSPYDYQEYSASNHGGSVYFDGTGSTNLTLTDIPLPATADFTAEVWIYALDVSQTNHGILSQYTSGDSQRTLLLIWNGDVRIQVGGSDLIGPPISTHQWYHLAWVRNSGTDTLYVNGVSEGTATFGSIQQTPMWIGDISLSTSEFNGYISDIKITNSAVYTSAFTPPTSPLSSSGARLHIKGTDASIIDKAQTSNLALAGAVSGSTTQVKFASTKSMYFDGNGDSLSITPGYDDIIYNFGTDDWTIEVWAYIQTLSSGRNLISFLRASTNEAVPHFYTMNTGLSYYVNNTDVITTPSVLSLNTWHHIALTRNGNDHKIFVDGTQVGSTWTNSITYVQGRPVLGDYHSSLNNLTGASNTLHGYVQDFRITKGLARYTANFTPPTSELQG